AISSGQFPAASPVAPADLGVIPAVLVTEAAPKIEITRVEPGLASAETRVRLWIPSEPRVPPFWIAFRGAPNVAAGRCAPASSSTTAENAARGAASNVSRASAAGALDLVRETSAVSADSTSSAGNLDGGALIRAGQRVELVMQAPGMRISTPVTALERGRAGQKIRVRSIPAGKLLVATVISAQLVEVDY
ncbi:MAG: flagella basal body P-ring formation protein FlgA, partial [Candidatus Acidiferrales bacterium]